MPAEVRKEWYKWLSGIKNIANFSFSWCVVRINSYKSAEMHVFSDAIPRLELVAALLTTHVACSVLQESNVKYERVVYWFDSAATLHLIRNSTRRFGVFVDARLAEIREISLLCNWRYFPTNLIPSEVGTRLIAPKKHKKFLPWIEGPKFLLSLDCEWPTLPVISDAINKSISSLI